MALVMHTHLKAIAVGVSSSDMSFWTRVAAWLPFILMPATVLGHHVMRRTTADTVSALVRSIGSKYRSEAAMTAWNECTFCVTLVCLRSGV